MVGRVILLFILILVNGFFSCAEIAVLQVGEAKIRKLSEEGNKKAKKLLKFTEEPSRFLSTGSDYSCRLSFQCFCGRGLCGAIGQFGHASYSGLKGRGGSSYFHCADYTYFILH